MPLTSEISSVLLLWWTKVIFNVLFRIQKEKKNRRLNGNNSLFLLFALSKWFHSGIILHLYFPHPKFPFLHFQCASLPFFVFFLFGVPLTLNLFQWCSQETGRASWSKKIHGERRGCAVISREQRPKAAIPWATGAEGSQERRGFFVRL